MSERAISTQVQMIQTSWGLSFGFYIFTFSVWFFENFKSKTSVEEAIYLTAVLLALRQGLIAILEGPAGALADSKIGRKPLILSGFFFRGIFYLLIAVLPLVDTKDAMTFLAYASSAAFSVSFACFNGALPAWISDACRAAGTGCNQASIIAKGHKSMFLAEMAAGIASVILYLSGYAEVSYYIGLSVCLIASIACYLHFKEQERFQTKSGVRSILEKLRALATIARATPSILSISLLFASVMFLVNVVDYFWPLYAHEHPYRGAVWIILVAAVGFVRVQGTSLVLRYCRLSPGSGRANPETQDIARWAVGIAFGAGALVLFLAALTYFNLLNIWIFGLCVPLILLAHGIIAPSYEALVNIYLPASHEKIRATVLSLGSLLRSMMIVPLAVVSGGKDPSTTTLGWAVPAVLVVASAIFAHFALKTKETKP